MMAGRSVPARACDVNMPPASPPEWTAITSLEQFQRIIRAKPSRSIVSLALDARDSTAALGFVNAMKDLPEHTEKGGALYVFAL